MCKDNIDFPVKGKKRNFQNKHKNKSPKMRDRFGKQYKNKIEDDLSLQYFDKFIKGHIDED